MTTTDFPSEYSEIQATIIAEIDKQVSRVRDAEARCKAAFLPTLAEHGITASRSAMMVVATKGRWAMSAPLRAMPRPIFHRSFATIPRWSGAPT